MIDYLNISDTEDEALMALKVIRENTANDTDYLNALVVLTNYLKGV